MFCILFFSIFIHFACSLNALAEELPNKAKNKGSAHELPLLSDLDKEKKIQGLDKKNACLINEKVMDELLKNKKALSAKEAELSALQKELEDREKSINFELNKIEQHKNSLNSKYNERLESDKKKSDKVVEIITQMSPKSGAKLLASLKDEVALQTLSQMDSDKLSKIFSNMDLNRSKDLMEKFMLFSSGASRDNN